MCDLVVRSFRFVCEGMSWPRRSPGKKFCAVTDGESRVVARQQIVAARLLADADGPAPPGLWKIAIC
jgi:hypothetical protein